MKELEDVTFKLCDAFAELVKRHKDNPDAHSCLKRVKFHLESRLNQTDETYELPPVGSYYEDLFESGI